ncbi:helix-turn-helix domain protein [Nitrosococcus halophilus Nc 4]|uniref:Helix-turn-helix domain protein n=1 Tax=Nitrosococcus halophilus (strain Nc4) TaxID=472759 RepID=D5C1F1_NITHN|nr:helix-turn-helix domain-containing protein [Nitrosococcus halophilus]ADE16503.1 helix-turn-helix domain protein [Nitrosococcus halophilus Nc 4]
MNEVFKSIKQGLQEAIEHVEGKPVKAIVHKPESVDVKAIREKVGMTQTEFAASFGISLGTLRHWERGDRKPHGPALVLLNVVAREPKAVLRALAQGKPNMSLNE